MEGGGLAPGIGDGLEFGLVDEGDMDETSGYEGASGAGIGDGRVEDEDANLFAGGVKG